MKILSKLLSWIRPVRSLDEERAAVEARRQATEARLDARMPANEVQLRRDLTP